MSFFSDWTSGDEIELATLVIGWLFGTGVGVNAVIRQAKTSNRRMKIKNFKLGHYRNFRGYRRWVRGWDRSNWWWRRWLCLALFFASLWLILHAFIFLSDGRTLAQSNVKVFFDGIALGLRPSGACGHGQKISAGSSVTCSVIGLVK
jgi:hypothetical protein